MCLELYLLLPDTLLLPYIGTEPPVLHVTLGNKYRVLMGKLLHGAQLVNRPVLVDLVSGSHQQTKLVGHHGVLHPTILKARLVHKSTGVCLTSSHATASPVKPQRQSKLELLRVLGQPLTVLQEVSVLLGVACHQSLQLVLVNM